MSKYAIGFPPDDPRSRSRTNQQFAKECDINNIMYKYGKTGILGDPSRPVSQPIFGDFSKDFDLRATLDLVRNANEQFMLLNSEVRSRFKNDVANVLDFVADPANAEEARNLGLLPKIDVNPVKVPVDPKPVGT